MKKLEFRTKTDTSDPKTYVSEVLEIRKFGNSEIWKFGSKVPEKSYFSYLPACLRLFRNTQHQKKKARQIRRLAILRWVTLQDGVYAILRQHHPRH
uniref:Transposase n=1 Tax=Caenorhabditis tropicalis TaxID=1561998 RepID=A0A1I7UAF8_9PELO